MTLQGPTKEIAPGPARPASGAASTGTQSGGATASSEGNKRKLDTEGGGMIAKTPNGHSTPDNNVGNSSKRIKREQANGTQSHVSDNSQAIVHSAPVVIKRKSGTDSSWHVDSAADLKFRETFLNQLYKQLLLTKVPMLQSNPERVKNLATRLELNLYKASRSKDEYMDMSTLYERLKILSDNTSPASQVLERILASIQEANNLAAANSKESDITVLDLMDTSETKKNNESNTKANTTIIKENDFKVAANSSHTQSLGPNATEDAKNISADELSDDSSRSKNEQSLSKMNVDRSDTVSSAATDTKLERSFSMPSMSSNPQSPDPNDEEAIKLAKQELLRKRQKRLILFYHANKCKKENCEFKNLCDEMKKLFQHVKSCSLETCPVKHCVSSKFLLLHFKSCPRNDCLICTPLRLMVNQRREFQAMRQKNEFEAILSSLNNGTFTVSADSVASPIQNGEASEIDNKDNFIDPKLARSCVSGTGPNLLEFKSIDDIMQHISSLKVEKLQPIVFPVLRKLMEHKHNRDIFNFPVDIVKYNIPHYVQIVKQPMDLGTVRQKLVDGKYQEFDQFDEDVRLVFQNAMLFNPPNHSINTLASSFLKSYEADITKLKQKLILSFQYQTGSVSKVVQSSANVKCNLCFQDNCEICPLCERGCLGFEPKVLYCSGTCSTRIQRNVYYYCTPNQNYCFCTDCFEKSKKKNYIEVHGGTKCKKTDLQKRKNNDVASEPWVSCDGCERWVHQICALFNPRKDDPGKGHRYFCPTCLMKKKKKELLDLKDIPGPGLSIPLTSDTKPGSQTPNSSKKRPLYARDLPRTHISDFVENWVQNEYTNLQRFEADNPSESGIIGDLGPDASSLIIRVLHSAEEVCKLKPFAKKYLDQVPSKIRYTSRCITMFQELDGIEVLIFIMFVQEFGSKLLPDNPESAEKKEEVDPYEIKDEEAAQPDSEPPDDSVESQINGNGIEKDAGTKTAQSEGAHNPNANKLYIAYLDTVHYFRPRRFRTQIYHALLLSYFEYCRRIGFECAYIWACPPPNKRDDYIIHCHPEDQRVPNPERLRKWYHAMAQTGREQNIITDVSTMFEEHFDSKNDKKTKGDSKKRKSKKKAMEEIKAANSSGKGKGKSKGSAGKGKGKKKGSKLSPSDNVDDNDSDEEEQEGLGLDDVSGNFKQAQCDAWKLESLEEKKRNKLAISQQMPYFDGDYWPQDFEEIAKDIESKQRKKAKLKLEKSMDIDADTLVNGNKADDIDLAADSSIATRRKMMFMRLAEQLSMMKQDFLVVKFAGECTKCGCYVKKIWYECRHKECVSCTQAPDATSPSNNDDEDAGNNADENADGENNDEENDNEGANDNLEEPEAILPYQKSKYVLCEKCHSVEIQKPVTERHGSQSLSVAMTSPRLPTNAVDIVAEVEERKSELIISPEESIARFFKPENALRSTRTQNMDVTESHELVRIEEDVPEKTLEIDKLVSSKLVDSRHTFLALCSSNRYQYSQLRRAKYSTMMLMYHVHNPDAPANLYTCSRCQKDILKKRRYNCVECNDYNLCEQCFVQEPHEHKMNPFLITNGIQQTSAESVRHHYESKRARHSSAFHLKALEHAATCEDENCPSIPCKKVKAMFVHNKTCPNREHVDQCQTCRHLYLLVNIHARRCKNDQCKFRVCFKQRMRLSEKATQQEKNQNQNSQSTVPGVKMKLKAKGAADDEKITTAAALS